MSHHKDSDLGGLRERCKEVKQQDNKHILERYGGTLALAYVSELFCTTFNSLSSGDVCSISFFISSLVRGHIRIISIIVGLQKDGK